MLLLPYRKLPVLKLVIRTHEYVFSHGLTLMRIGWLPVTLTVSVMLGSAYLQTQEAYSDPASAFLLGAGEILADTFIGSVFAVAVHRMVLLDEPAPKRTFYFVLGRTEATFILASILFFTVTFLFSLTLIKKIALPIAGQFGIVGAYIALLASIIVTGLLASKVMLLFPHIVKGGGIDPPHAWKIMRDNWARAFLAFVMIYLPILGLNTGLAILLDVLDTPTDQLPANDIAYIVCSHIIYYWGIALIATLLSFSYRILTDNTNLH